MALDKNDLKQIEKIVTGVETNIGKKISKIDSRLDAHDKRFDDIDKKFEGIDKKFEKVDKRFEGIDRKIDSVYCSLNDKIDSFHYGLTKSMGEMEHRIISEIHQVIADQSETNRAIIAEIGKYHKLEKTSDPPRD